jgi:NADPH-dependent curcumin reductase CurA
MPAISAREIRLKSRPIGLPKPENFEFAAAEAPAPEAGQVQVRNLWMSVDPYMRGRMRDGPSYAPPYPLGAVMYGAAVGEVVASGDDRFKPGDLVDSQMGWREAFTAPAGAVNKLPPDNVAPPQAYLGVLGMPGLTAYSGLLRIGQPKEGETAFVSGAAGIVGSTVCQIAKIKGCRVIGSAGSDQKIAWLKDRGVDHVVNYKKGDLLAQVRAGAPKGVDIYFDNVGGEHLEVAIELANTFARFAECGMISGYNETDPIPGPRNMMQIVGKQLTIRGFIVSSFADMRAQFLTDMTAWIKDGKVKWEETVEHGLDNAPKAFLNLFSGANTGKMLVKLT